MSRSKKPPVSVQPAYGEGSLADLLPSVANMLRASQRGNDPEASVFAIPPARRACVVLVDGLGAQLLRGAGGYASFLRHEFATHGTTITSGFPSTTATSLGSLGTGMPPGAHGLLGYEILNPDRDTLINLLKWDAKVDPLAWQPEPTVFEQMERDGLTVGMVGPRKFENSGLTLAALRGSRYLAAEELQGRVRRTVKALSDGQRDLVYLYWGDIDKVGHGAGCGSQMWAEELQFFDRAMQKLIAQLPKDTALIITADHGMVDAPRTDCVDLAEYPDLRTDVVHRGGEARATQLYVRPGSAPDVSARWAQVMGERAWVATRDEAIAKGWFGVVRPNYAARIGDVIIAARGTSGVVDSDRMPAHQLAMVGQHGSLTPAEMNIPLIVTRGQA